VEEPLAAARSGLQRSNETPPIERVATGIPHVHGESG
jgi:hypothetical protein